MRKRKGHVVNFICMVVAIGCILGIIVSISEMNDPKQEISTDGLYTRLLETWDAQSPYNLLENPETRKYAKERVQHWEEVALDVITVNVNKTMDQDEYVITLKNSKGQESSLWLKGNKVQSITSY